MNSWSRVGRVSDEVGGKAGVAIAQLSGITELGRQGDRWALLTQEVTCQQIIYQNQVA